MLLYQDENGKKCLAVDLVYEFGRTRDGELPPSVDNVAVAAVTKKPAATATLKLLKESENRALQIGKTAEEVAALQALHACDDRRCPNFGQYCWKNPDDDRHYKINAASFTA